MPKNQRVAAAGLADNRVLLLCAAQQPMAFSATFVPTVMRLLIATVSPTTEDGSKKTFDKRMAIRLKINLARTRLKLWEHCS
jgi:hypothetical protein